MTTRCVGPVSSGNWLLREPKGLKCTKWDLKGQGERVAEKEKLGRGLQQTSYASGIGA